MPWFWDEVWGRRNLEIVPKNATKLQGVKGELAYDTPIISQSNFIVSTYWARFRFLVPIVGHLAPEYLNQRGDAVQRRNMTLGFLLFITLRFKLVFYVLKELDHL